MGDHPATCRRHAKRVIDVQGHQIHVERIWNLCVTQLEMFFLENTNHFDVASPGSCKKGGSFTHHFSTNTFDPYWIHGKFVDLKSSGHTTSYDI